MILHVTDDSKKEYSFDVDKLCLSEDSFLLVKVPTDKYPVGKICDMAKELRNCLKCGNRVVFVPADLDFNILDKESAKKFFQDRIADIENM